MIPFPFVWELEYEGVRSHLVGTAHLLQKWPHTPDFRPAAHEILAGKSHLLQEVYAPNGPSTQTLATILGQRMGQKMEEWSSEDKATVEKLTGEDFVTVQNMLYLFFPLKIAHKAGITFIPGIERILEEAAVQYLIPITSLETEDEQIEFLRQMYEASPTSLREIILQEQKSPGSIHQQYRQRFSDFLDGREEGIFQMQDVSTAMRLRNQNMAKRSLEYLTKPSVVAVGAAHCIGEESIPEIYREYGVSVTRT